MWWATILVVMTQSAFADPSDKIGEVFSAEGIDGTLVVASADGKIVQTYNADRAAHRFSPASTFKIPNTLIALDAGVVKSKDSTFEWDGIDRGLAVWNQDQTLQSAFSVSCVWCYQEIARLVGARQYHSALARMDYGNRQTGEEVDQFWLNDDLQISAIEQIRFLSHLVDNTLPYSLDFIDIVKTIMLTEQTDDYALYAKTGWTGSELQVGWFVGYVETTAGTWLFSMNMRMDNAAQAPLRKDLTMRSLRALGILR